MTDRGAAACAQPPGAFAPAIDPSHCEGKADCAAVYPYDVFVVRKLDAAERHALPLIARLKVWVHGGKQGFVVNPDRCRACGLCVTACPEKAISLTRLVAEMG